MPTITETMKRYAASRETAEEMHTPGWLDAETASINARRAAQAEREAVIFKAAFDEARAAGKGYMASEKIGRRAVDAAAAQALASR